MSQPSSHIPTPPATTVQDWLAVLDSAIQSNSDNDGGHCKSQERAENKCWEREVVELHRQEEVEHWEREENECWEREMQACGEWESMERCETQADSWVRSTGTQSHDLVAEVKCTYKLAKAIGMKKAQKCIMPEGSTSPRAGEKKKCVRAKSPEVEIVGGSSQTEKGKGVAHDTLITRGLYAIAKSLGSLHHHVIESMVELLQETTYLVLEVPAKSGSEESAVESPGDTNAKGELDEEVETSDK
ncbi:hypothetical protein F5141DRAFT_1065489 [Pisolithus sp. B1]|nr:hypothetical protein F5141DRAFT_1065489 [Pisolithus sp. B1]